MEMNNENGMTLVELLAAIVLTTIIGVIAYSVLASGFSTYDRVQEEANLRDEADLIVASLIKELYPLKLSEIQSNHLPENKTNNYYLLLKDGKKIGFLDNTVFVRDRKIELSDTNIRLSSGTRIEQIIEGRYRITLTLENINSGRTIETISEIGLINDTDRGAGDNETSNR